MRVTLDRRGDYAVRAVFDLARHPDGLRKSREIAESMSIPRGFLTQVLADLVRSGLLEATAGPSGGYRLARPPATITVFDVMVAAEGPVCLERCVLRERDCDGANPCVVHDVWSAAQEAFSRRLAETSFEDLTRGGIPGILRDS